MKFEVLLKTFGVSPFSFLIWWAGISAQTSSKYQDMVFGCY
jgi:hypothetical protein